MGDMDYVFLDLLSSLDQVNILCVSLFEKHADIPSFCCFLIMLHNRDITTEIDYLEDKKARLPISFPFPINELQEKEIY